jgi:hypothetical protein
MQSYRKFGFEEFSLATGYLGEQIQDFANNDNHQEKIDVTQDLYQTIKRRSPVRSGKFKRSWTRTVSTQGAKINNPQPYSQRLEEGHSPQAPLGVVKPAIEEVIKRRQTIRRK